MIRSSDNRDDDNDGMITISITLTKDNVNYNTSYNVDDGKINNLRKQS